MHISLGFLIPKIYSPTFYGLWVLSDWIVFGIDFGIVALYFHLEALSMYRWSISFVTDGFGVVVGCGSNSNTMLKILVGFIRLKEQIVLYITNSSKLDEIWSFQLSKKNRSVWNQQNFDEVLKEMLGSMTWFRMALHHWDGRRCWNQIVSCVASWKGMSEDEVFGTHITFMYLQSVPFYKVFFIQLT